MNIDKSNWQLTRLGDLLIDISKRVDNPSQSGYDRFVGLEHFVSGDIKIKNWGNTENLTSSTKAFKAGDILFARRNAYLRRASLVDFDGCCSGDAFVLRENYDKVVPGYMAFFMNSNTLWDFANENAAGTMSQRVKWRDLDKYEFLLPPKDHQAKLAEFLWTMDEVVQKERSVHTSIVLFMNSFIEEKINTLFYKKNQEYFKLDDIVEIRGRVGWKGYKKTDLRDSGPIVIGAKDIDSFNRLCLTDPTFLSQEKFEESPEIKVSQRDILIVQRGNTIGKMVHFLEDIKEVTINPSMVLLKNIKIDDNYLFAVLISPFTQKIVESISSTTAIPMITQFDIKKFKIPKLSKEEMKSLGIKVFHIRSLIEKVEMQIESSKALQKSLINQIF